MSNLLTRRQQVCAKIGTAGTEPTWSTVETAANAAFLVYEPSVDPEQTLIRRNPNRAQIGTLPGVPGAVMETVSFVCELKGSGTAGVAPKIGPLLRACGLSQTINTGTASIGTTIVSPSNRGTVVPTFAGTYTGTKSGILELTVAARSLSGVLASCVFRPGDGTAVLQEQDTQTGASPEVMATAAPGVSFDFGDPSASVAGIEVGDRFYVPLTSDQQVSVEYKPIDDIEGDAPTVDISVLQDGRAKRLHSCRGTFEITWAFNDYAKVAFTFMGIPVADADVALLTGIGYETTVPPPFLNLTDTLLFTEDPAPCFTNASLALNNELAMRPCAVGHPSGYQDAKITSRAVTMEIDPHAQLVAVVNFFELMRNGTQGDLAFTLGSTAGNIVKFSTSTAQITDIDQGDADGDMIDNLSLSINQPPTDGGSGYGEFSLLFR